MKRENKLHDEKKMCIRDRVKSVRASCTTANGIVDFRGRSATVAEIQAEVNGNAAKSALVSYAQLGAEEIPVSYTHLIELKIDTSNYPIFQATVNNRLGFKVSVPGSTCLLYTSSAWGLKCYYEGILGLRRTYEGLKIEPVLPDSWKSVSAERVYRGNRLVIRYRNEQSGTVRLIVDGEPVEGLSLIHICACKDCERNVVQRRILCARLFQIRRRGRQKRRERRQDLRQSAVLGDFGGYRPRRAACFRSRCD